MLGLSPQDTWLAALLALSGGAFIIAARWSSRFSSDRALTAYSVGFSLAFVALALVAGLSLFR